MILSNDGFVAFHYSSYGDFFDVKETEKYIFGKDIDVIAIKCGYHAEAHNEIF